MADFTPQSRNEAILDATINGTEYTALPQSRIEALLIQLKDKIEQGGGVIIDDAMSDVSTNAVENKTIKAYVDNEIDKAIDACYHPAGSKTCAELISALLIADNLGNVYNTTDTGTTTADFVEGAGKTIDLGSDVAIVNIGTSENPIYKFNVLGGFVDLSNINEDISNLQTTTSNNGAKNLLPMTLEGIKALNANGTWSGNAYTYNGVTFTVNTDSNGNVTSITASGTANATINFRLCDMNNPSGLIMSGCPSGGASNKYYMRIAQRAEPYTEYFEYGNGQVIGSFTYNITSIYVSIVNGYAIPSGGLTFYPMIRLATDTDSTFQPYAKTNLELTDDVRDIDYRLEENACANIAKPTTTKWNYANDTGIYTPKNLSDYGDTISEIDCNVGDWLTITFIIKNNLPGLNSTISVLDSNDTTLATFNNYAYGYVVDTIYQKTFKATTNKLKVVSYKASGTSANSFGIQIMISRNPNAPYEPYYPSNKELASTRPALKSGTFTVALNTKGYGKLSPTLKGVVPLFYSTLLGNINAFIEYSNGDIGVSCQNADSHNYVASTTVSGTLYYYEL